MATYRADDLTPILLPAPTSDVGFRQGTVLTWNTTTAANTIDVGGTVLTNVPIVGSAEIAAIAPGAIVGILTVGSSWVILGKITAP